MNAQTAEQARLMQNAFAAGMRADPEPVIGPGMILERGRERVEIRSSADAMLRTVKIYTRSPFSRNWGGLTWQTWSDDDIRDFMRKARVIRPSDPPAQQEPRP